MFIGMAKSATDALDGQMEGIASEHEMVNIRHGQLEQGQEIHTVTLNCAAIVVELTDMFEGKPGVVTLPHVEGKGRSHLVVRPAASSLLVALEARIAAGSLRVVLHDSSRAATLLQRIFRRLEVTTDGRTLHDLGVICDAAQWGVARDSVVASFQRVRDVLAIAPSLTLQCIDAVSLEFTEAAARDYSVELPSYG